MEKALLGVAGGVVKSAVGKLGSFLWNEALLWENVRQDIQFVRDELQSMDGFLQDLVRTEHRNNQMKVWMLHVLELACDAELCIDYFTDVLDKHYRHWVRATIEKSVYCLWRSSHRYKIAKTIQELKSRAKEVSERRSRYNVTILEGHNVTIRREQVTDTGHQGTPLPPYLICHNQIIAEDALVGINYMASMNDILKPGVTAITGPIGSGKTVRAKMLFRRKNELQHNITGAAWVTLSRQPDIKMVLKDILRQVMKCPLDEIRIDGEAIRNIVDDNRLTEILRAELSKQSRFLIVLDSLWETNHWDSIEPALPDQNYRDRGIVIVTTRSRDVAYHCCSNDLSKCKIVKTLTKDQRNELANNLYFKHFNYVDNPYKHELEPAVDYCCSVPLVIKCLFGVLAGADGDITIVNQVAIDVIDIMKQTLNYDEKIVQMIKLCYRHLPPLLKKCFLDLRTIPDGCVIKRKRLMRRWIAKGFISSRGGFSTEEELAESYFDKLTSRCVIEPENIQYDGRAKNCILNSIFKDISGPRATNAMRSGSNPQSSNAESNPQASNAGSNPQSSGAQSDPQSSGTQSNPQASNTGSNPQSSNAQSNPHVSNTGGDPQSSSARSNPQSSNAQSNPQASNTGSDPQSSNAQRNPQSSNARSNPQASNNGSDPQASNTGSDSQSSNAQSNPQASNTGGDPQSSNAQRNLQSSSAQSDLQSSNARRDPQSSNAPHNPLASTTDHDALQLYNFESHSMILNNVTEKLSPENYKYISILDFEGCQCLSNHQLNSLPKFIKLKFLSLRNTNISHLPEKIGNLHQLETLDIRETKINTMPRGIINLNCLKYFLAGHSHKPERENTREDLDSLPKGVKVPEGMMGMRALQTLAKVSATKASKLLHVVRDLKHLKKLGLVIEENNLNSKPLGISIMMLSGSLRSLSVHDERGGSNPGSLEFLEYMCFPPELLKSLNLKGHLRMLPHWIVEHKHLSKLTLSETQLSGDAIRLLGKVESLLCLKLYNNSLNEHVLTFGENEFKNLLVLVCHCDAVQKLQFKNGAAPELKIFKWVFTKNQVGKLEGIEYLQKIKEISLIGQVSTIISHDINYAVSAHPNRKSGLVLEKIERKIREHHYKSETIKQGFKAKVQGYTATLKDLSKQALSILIKRNPKAFLN